MSNPTTGDISPEHTARAMNNDLHPEVGAAYAYVDRVLHTADCCSGSAPAWHGWALREAFLAGCSHAAALAQPEPVGPEPGYEKGYAQEHLARLMRDAIGTETNHNAYILAAGKILDRPEFAHVARWGAPANNTSESTNG